MIINPSSPMLSDSSHTTFSSSEPDPSNSILLSLAFSYIFTNKDVQSMYVLGYDPSRDNPTTLVRGNLPVTVPSTVCRTLCM